MRNPVFSVVGSAIGPDGKFWPEATDFGLLLARTLDKDGYAQPSRAGTLLGEVLRSMLGHRYADFDARFSALIGAEPAHKTPAETVLREMGIVP